jgi:dual specificity phosphatase 12
MQDAHVTEIIPNLWLGDYNSALNSNFLKTKKIKLVVNCTTHIDSLNRETLSLVLPILDTPITNLGQKDAKIWIELVQNIVDIVDMFLKKNEAVLIHCHRGVQRSASIVAAYLMYLGKGKITPKEAIQTILKRRPIAFNWGKNVNFMACLDYYYYNISKI